MENFCSNCGKKLVEGEPCSCNPTVSNAYQQEVYQQCPHLGQAYQPRGYWGNGGSGQWFQEKKGLFAKNVKVMSKEILPILREPDTSIKKITESKNSVIGIQMIGLKSLILVMIAIIVVSKLKRASYDLADISLLKLILLLIFSVFGNTYLRAGIFKGTVHLFGGKTTFNRMLFAGGISALIDSLYMLPSALLSISLPKVSIIVMGAGFLLSSLFYIKGYENGVEMNPNKKIYCFVVAQILYLVTAGMILYTTMPFITDYPLGNLMRGIIANLY